MNKKSSAITQPNPRWLWRWADSETTPTVLPKSKTERLALQAKLANKDAEIAIAKAYQSELLRTKAISEAMFKSGKALRHTVVSSYRQVLLRVEAARRAFEPLYRNR